MTITKTLKPISIALAVIYANGVYAQTSNLLDDASLTLGTVVVSGASGPISTRNLPTSVDILGAEKIQNQVVTNNWQIFGQMPGIMLTQFNQGNVSGKFSLRGFNGEGEINAVKLLIDGIPSNSNDGNMPYLELTNPLDIEAIEVVRGTNDPRYGLHNIAGNADVITRIGGNYQTARASYGSFDTRNVQYAAGFDNGLFSQNYTASYLDSTGYRDHSDTQRSSFAGKWFFTPESGNARFGFIARHHKADAEEAGYLTYTQSRDDDRQSPAHNAFDQGDRELNQFSAHMDIDLNEELYWETKAYLNQIDDRRYVRFSENVSQQERYTKENHIGALSTLTWRPEVDWANEFALMGGVSAEFQDNESDRYLTNQRIRQSQTRGQQFDLDIYGAFVQAVVKPTANLKLVPAYRVESLHGSYTNELTDQRFDINDYGLIHQPKFSAVYSFTDNYAAYANWGKTFQVGVGTGTYRVDNDRDLDPSINEGFEIGFKFRPVSWLDGRVAIWQQTASNEARRALNDPNNSSENIGKTERQGIDLQFNAQATDQLALWFAASLQRSEILKADSVSPESKGQEIDHVPNYLLNAGVDYQATQKLGLSFWTSAQDSYYLERTNSTREFGQFFLMNASASYAVTPKVRLELQLKNLANRYYEYVWFDGTQSLHSPGDGRAVYGSVQVDF